MVGIGDVVDVTIERLAASGSGVGFVQADTPRAIFVPYGVPGDMLQVRVVAQRKVYFEAEIVEVMMPSVHRIKPVCPHFGVCGACEWLHIAYEEQLAQKKLLLEHAFLRKGLSVPKIAVVPSVSPLYYRSKVRFPGDGFSARKSNAIVKVDQCHLLDRRLWPVLHEVRRRGECFALDADGVPTQGLSSYMFEGLELFFDPAGFVQANLSTNALLVAQVLSLLDGEKVLDLYAGNGNFSLPLSRKVRSVVAVEGDRGGFSFLQRNLLHNKVENVKAVQCDVREFSIGERFDAVVLDPPRVGAGKDVLEKVLSATSSVVYVSCDASALAADLAPFLRDGRLVLESLVLVDMFPQTHHFETIAKLARKQQ